MAAKVVPRFLCPELVGREAELATLTSLFGELSAGAKTVLIAGEAGLGKSALVSRAMDLGRKAGMRVARGQSERIEMRRPFGPMIDALMALRSDGKSASEALALVALSNPRATEVERYRAHAALARAFAEIVRQGPLLLILEDLHWADEETLELFGYLGRRMAGPLVLVGTYRSEELSERRALRSTIADLPRDRLWELSLRPLREKDLGPFLRSTLGPGLRISEKTREVLHSRSGGNPLFLEEILRALAERGQLTNRGNAWEFADVREIPLPLSVRAAVRERWGALADPVRHVVSVAAIIGERFPFAVLARANARGDQEVAIALRAAVDVELITETETQDVFEFRHTLTRDGILDGLLGRERRALHEQVAKALEAERPAPDPAVLAHHYAEAGDRSRAHELFDAAAKQARARFAFAESLRYLERALDLAPNDDRIASDLELRIGEMAKMLRRPAGARAVQDAALRYERIGDVIGRARALLAMRDLGWQLGWTLERQQEITDTLVRILEPLGDTRELAMTYAGVPISHYLKGEKEDPGLAATNAKRGLAIAERIGASYERTAGLNRLGSALLYSGDLAGAVAALREQLRLAEENGFVDRIPVALFSLAYALVRIDGRSDEAVALNMRQRVLAEQYGVQFGPDWRMRHHEFLYTGDWDEFLRLSDDVTEDDAIEYLHMSLHRAVIEVARSGENHLQPARAAVKRVLASGADYGLELATRYGAESLIVAGHYEEALAALEPIAALLAKPLRWEPMATSTGILALIAAAAISDDRSTQRWIALIERAAAHQTLGRIQPHLERAHKFAAAEKSVREGNLDEAIAMLAILTAEPPSPSGGGGVGVGGVDTPAPNRFVTHWLELRYIDLLVRRNGPGDASLASRILSSTVKPWRKGNATWYLERLRDRAARWGIAFPEGDPETKRDPTALTRREHEVALLIARGLSNREIAEKLVITERTAEGFVTRILTKRGFRSRVQIASWVSDLYGRQV